MQGTQDNIARRRDEGHRDRSKQRRKEQKRTEDTNHPKPDHKNKKKQKRNFSEVERGDQGGKEKKSNEQKQILLPLLHDLPPVYRILRVHPPLPNILHQLLHLRDIAHALPTLTLQQLHQKRLMRRVIRQTATQTNPKHHTPHHPSTHRRPIPRHALETLDGLPDAVDDLGARWEVTTDDGVQVDFGRGAEDVVGEFATLGHFGFALGRADCVLLSLELRIHGIVTGIR